MRYLKIGSIHLLLWILLFITFFNIQNAISGFPKETGYHAWADIELYANTLCTLFLLAVPFYFGYLILPFLLKKENKVVFSLVLLFAFFYPLGLSIIDDGFQLSVLLQALFLFAFYNSFLIFGAGFRALTKWLWIQTPKDRMSDNYG